MASKGLEFRDSVSDFAYGVGIDKFEYTLRSPSREPNIEVKSLLIIHYALKEYYTFSALNISIMYLIYIQWKLGSNYVKLATVL
jgi:hypothetical protein